MHTHTYIKISWEEKKIDVTNYVWEMRKALDFLVEYWMLEDDGVTLSNSQ